MIPVLDWSEAQTDRDGFRTRLGAAVRETGFFLLAGSQVPEDLRAEVLRLADVVVCIQSNALTGGSS